MTWHDFIPLGIFGLWTLFVLCAGIAIGHQWGRGQRPKFVPDRGAVMRSLGKSTQPIRLDEEEEKPDKGRYESDKMAGGSR